MPDLRRPRVVITHRVHDEILDLLGPHADVVANQTPATLEREEIARRAHDADALIVFMPDLVDRALLDACPRLAIVAGALRGYDNIDVAACTERNIWVTVVPELLAEATAELGIGLLVALARRVPEGDAFVRGGTFAGWRPELYARGIAGSAVGIAGFGQLGRAIAVRLAGFRADVRYADAHALDEGDAAGLGVRYAPLDELIATSDHLVLALPLTAATRGLIDARRIATMRRGATLVNLARGSLVDEEAVAAALASGHLGGYAADVFAFEDWAVAGRPRAIPAALLAQRDRTIFTPHLGSAVGDVRRAIERSAAEATLDAIRGRRPAGAVNAPMRGA
jgi:phosphonate dehydrogenase